MSILYEKVVILFCALVVGVAIGNRMRTRRTVRITQLHEHSAAIWCFIAGVPYMLPINVTDGKKCPGKNYLVNLHTGELSDGELKLRVWGLWSAADRIPLTFRNATRSSIGKTTERPSARIDNVIPLFPDNSA